jgi:hypothetical protein
MHSRDGEWKRAWKMGDFTLVPESSNCPLDEIMYFFKTMKFSS